MRGSSPEDMRVLRALWNIFNAFSAPREELLEAAEQQGTPAGVSPSSSSLQLANGARLPCSCAPLLDVHRGSCMRACVT